MTFRVLPPEDLCSRLRPSPSLPVGVWEARLPRRPLVERELPAGILPKGSPCFAVSASVSAQLLCSQVTCVAGSRLTLLRSGTGWTSAFGTSLASLGISRKGGSHSNQAPKIKRFYLSSET